MSKIRLLLGLLAPVLAACSAAALAHDLDLAIDAACANHQALMLTGDQILSAPLSHSCNGLVIDLGGGTLSYAGPNTRAIVDIRPLPTEPWRVNVTIRNGTISGQGNADVALSTWAVSHSVFENLRLRDVRVSGYYGTYLVTNSYRDIRCSVNEAPWQTQPQSCFVVASDGTPGGFGMWASVLENLIAEGLSGTGISISTSSFNTLIAGTSEKNAVGLKLNGDYNLVLNLDLEANSIADQQVTGRNVFLPTREAQQ